MRSFMFYIQCTPSYEGSVNWLVHDGGGEGVAICFEMAASRRHTPKFEALADTAGLIEKNSMTWITPGAQAWKVDADELLKMPFAEPLRAKRWNWLTGSFLVAPEAEMMPKMVDDLTYMLSRAVGPDERLNTVLYLLPKSRIAFPLSPAANDVLSRRYQVFLSSTFADLQQERQEVLMALLGMDCIPVGMELFPATPQQWEWIERAIRESDYYVVIVAGRYGSMDAATGLSFTEREFDYALSIGKPILGFYHADVDKLPGSKLELDPEKRRKLEAFLSKVKNQRLCKSWLNGAELKAAIQAAIFQQLKTNPQSGWVRYSEVAATLVGTSKMAAEVKRLEVEVEQLRSNASASVAKPSLVVEPLFKAMEVVDERSLHTGRPALKTADVLHVKVRNLSSFPISIDAVGFAQGERRIPAIFRFGRHGLPQRVQPRESITLTFFQVEGHEEDLLKVDRIYVETGCGHVAYASAELLNGRRFFDPQLSLE